MQYFFYLWEFHPDEELFIKEITKYTNEDDFKS